MNGSYGMSSRSDSSDSGYQRCAPPSCCGQATGTAPTPRPPPPPHTQRNTNLILGEIHQWLLRNVDFGRVFRKLGSHQVVEVKRCVCRAAVSLTVALRPHKTHVAPHTPIRVDTSVRGMTIHAWKQTNTHTDTATRHTTHCRGYHNVRMHARPGDPLPPTSHVLVLASTAWFVALPPDTEWVPWLTQPMNSDAGRSVPRLAVSRSRGEVQARPSCRLMLSQSPAMRQWRSPHRPPQRRDLCHHRLKGVEKQHLCRRNPLHCGVAPNLPQRGVPRWCPPPRAPPALAMEPPPLTLPWVQARTTMWTVMPTAMLTAMSRPMPAVWQQKLQQVGGVRAMAAQQARRVQWCGGMDGADGRGGGAHQACDDQDVLPAGTDERWRCHGSCYHPPS